MNDEKKTLTMVALIYHVGIDGDFYVESDDPEHVDSTSKFVWQ